MTREGHLDVSALAALSNAAIAAERYAEAAAAGPALPQRLGRSRDDNGDWQPLRPHRVTLPDAARPTRQSRCLSRTHSAVKSFWSFGLSLSTAST